MRHDYENHSNSYMRVDARLIQYDALWSSKPGIAANVAAFRQRQTAIDGKRIIALADTIGQTQAKNNLKKAMANQADKNGDVLRTLATKNNDPELFQLAKFGPRDIIKMADTDADVRCTQIYTAANDRAAALADEGLDPADIALLNARIGSYHGAINLPRLKQEDIKAANESLDFLIPDMNKFLRNVLDGNVRALPDNPTNFEFKQAYKLAREIIDNVGGGGGSEEPPPPAPPGP